MSRTFMYNFVVGFQIFSIVFLVLGTAYIFFKWKTVQHKYLFIFCFSTVINNLGYLMEMTAKGIAPAMAGLRFAYLGKVLIPLGCFAFIMEFVNLRVPKKIYALMTAFHLTAFFLVLTSQYQSIFYSQIRFVSYGLFPHLILDRGIFWYIYMTVCIGYLLGGAFIMTRYYIQCKNPRRKKQMRMLIASVGFMGVGFLPVFFGWTGEYDTTAMGYTFSILFMYIALFKYDLLDTRDAVMVYAMDNFPSGIIAVDDEGQIAYTNEIAQKIVGEIKGNEAEILNNLDRMVENHETKVVNDHSYFATLKLLDVKGQINGKVYTLIDDTERLEYLKQLEEQKESAEAANNAKSRFLSVVTHEIRTPMNAVVGMTDLMLEEPENLNQKQLKYLNNIKNSGQALVMIVNDILDQSKLEAGKMELVLEPFDIREISTDIKLIIENRIGEKPIECQIMIDDRVPKFLVGDGLRVRQILINLLNNAVKFTQEGFVRLSVHYLGRVEGKMKIRFSILDTGQGIKPEDLSKLGEAFAQVDIKKNHNKEGTGLGLSISKDFISLMGGQLEVTSEYGKGSEFFFDVLLEGADELDEKETKPETQISVKNTRILVVDDTPVNLEIAEATLGQLGAIVDKSITGTRAIEMVKKVEYDLIFMDYRMPKLDGVETIKQIRALADSTVNAEKKAYFKNVPIIALSGDDSEEAKEAFLEAGAIDFAEKPLKKAESKKILEKWIDKDKMEVSK